MVTDLLGDELFLEDYVFFDSEIYVIKKFTPKMITVQNLSLLQRLQRSSFSGKRHIYAKDCVKLDPDKVLVLMMKSPYKKGK